MQLPKNKFLRLIINIGLIFVWIFLSRNPLFYVQNKIILYFELYSYDFFKSIYKIFINIFHYLPMFFITRFIWFEKSRNRIFYGLFDKLKYLQRKISQVSFTKLLLFVIALTSIIIVLQSIPENKINRTKLLCYEFNDLYTKIDFYNKTYEQIEDEYGKDLDRLDKLQEKILKEKLTESDTERVRSYCANL